MLQNFFTNGELTLYVAILIDARQFKKGKTLKDYLRIKPEEWDSKLAEIQGWLAAAENTAKEKVELRILTHDSVQDLTLEEVKDQICW